MIKTDNPTTKTIWLLIERQGTYNKILGFVEDQEEAEKWLSENPPEGGLTFHIIASHNSWAGIPGYNDSDVFEIGR